MHASTVEPPAQSPTQTRHKLKHRCRIKARTAGVAEVLARQRVAPPVGGVGGGAVRALPHLVRARPVAQPHLAQAGSRGRGERLLKGAATQARLRSRTWAQQGAVVRRKELEKRAAQEACRRWQSGDPSRQMRQATNFWLRSRACHCRWATQPSSFSLSPSPEPHRPVPPVHLLVLPARAAQRGLRLWVPPPAAGARCAAVGTALNTAARHLAAAR